MSLLAISSFEQNLANVTIFSQNSKKQYVSMPGADVSVEKEYFVSMHR